MDILLVILTIIGGLAGFLKDRKDKASESPKRSMNSPRPTPAPSGGNVRSFRSDSQRHTEKTITIEERHQEQRDRLAERMNTATKAELNDGAESPVGAVNKRSMTDFSKERRQFKGQVKRNLTRNGLMNGIIMAEILGPSRAVKPYRSLVEQRRK